MLPRSHRIQSNQFPNVTRGKSFMSDLFRVVVKPDNTINNPKCAVIVSNKIAKTAVARNRIRRQVYAALGEIMDRLPVAYVSVFPKSSDMEYADIVRDLKTTFKK